MPNVEFTAGKVKQRAATPFSRRLHLLMQLVKRDLSLRFAGSLLGVAWTILQPLSLIVLYWFVFAVMIPRDPNRSGGDFVLFLISGLIPWLAFNEGMVRSATSVVDNGPLVRRLAFESELLAVVPNVSALALEIIGLVILTAYLFLNGVEPGALLLLPVALLLQFLLQTGLGWIAATSCVFLRDVPQILSFLLSFVFFLSPIVYDIGGSYRWLFAWNPMTALLGLFRSALLSAPLPSTGSLVFLMFSSFTAFGAGLWFFRKAQPTLADLI